MKKYLLTVAVCFLIFDLAGQEMPAAEVIERAINFHDPTNRWYKTDIALVVDTEMPSSSKRTSLVELNNRTGGFSLKIVKDSELFEWHMPFSGEAEFRRNFQIVTDSTALAKWQLTEERAIWWRDYYSYLYGLPMNLKDEGSQWDEKGQMTQFQNKEVWSVRVTYSPEVGKDTWYFYFDVNTFALVGYRFYHNETDNDGEYIVLEDMEIVGNLRIPKKRTWYTNQDKRLLGEDLLVNMKIEK